ncbi:hypothetical protein CsatB_026670 [Cannabis sativa]
MVKLFSIASYYTRKLDRSDQGSSFDSSIDGKDLHQHGSYCIPFYMDLELMQTSQSW